MHVSTATVRRYLRSHVTLPDGSVIHGSVPGASAVTLTEHHLRDALARQLGGITEACLPYGRADVMTPTAVFEVEPYRSWRNGIRQALGYSAQCGLPPGVALFGKVHHEALLKLYLRLRDGRPPIALWWWNGGRWESIGSRKACRNMSDVAIMP
jgi:hypothetical protein